MFKKTSVNLLDGPILRSIITFAIPILISNVFQQLYNTADIMIVGRYLGPNALAGVGATAAIFELVIGFCAWSRKWYGRCHRSLFWCTRYDTIKTSSCFNISNWASS